MDPSDSQLNYLHTIGSLKNFPSCLLEIIVSYWHYGSSMFVPNMSSNSPRRVFIGCDLPKQGKLCKVSEKFILLPATPYFGYELQFKVKNTTFHAFCQRDPQILVDFSIGWNGDFPEGKTVKKAISICCHPSHNGVILLVHGTAYYFDNKSCLFTPLLSMVYFSPITLWYKGLFYQPQDKSEAILNYYVRDGSFNITSIENAAFNVTIRTSRELNSSVVLPDGLLIFASHQPAFAIWRESSPTVLEYHCGPQPKLSRIKRSWRQFQYENGCIHVAIQTGTNSFSLYSRPYPICNTFPSRWKLQDEFNEVLTKEHRQ